MEHLLTEEIIDDLYYIGTNDRHTELFEGMWPLPNGVAYNSYLLKGKENIVFDIVKVNTIQSYLEKLQELLGDEDLHYIVVNHMEPDHTSGLLSVLNRYPHAKIVCNKKAVDMLDSFYFKNDNLIVVKEGETLEIDKYKFTFYMTPMVHWPESMVCFEENHKILFSQDIFGGFGTLDGAIFDDEVEFNTYYLEETTRYFINIVGKYAKQALKALKKLESLDIDMICPDHGPVWRSHPDRIIDLYTRLAQQETVDGVVIIYGSMYGNTERMAEAVAKGVKEEGIKNIKIRDITKTSFSYLLSDCWRYKGVILGSCSYDNNLFPPMSFLTMELSHQRMSNNVWGFWGTYSWSGGAHKKLKAFMEDNQYDAVSLQPEIKSAANPEEMKELIELGRRVARRVKGQPETDENLA